MKTILYATLLAAATLFPPMLCSAASEMDPLFPNVIAELKEMKKEYEGLINSQNEEQQQIMRYQIETITLLLRQQEVQLTEAHEHVAEIQETDEHEQPAEAPFIDYYDNEPPLVSNAGSINNYETTHDFLRRLKKKKRRRCWNW